MAYEFAGMYDDALVGQVCQLDLKTTIIAHDDDPIRHLHEGIGSSFQGNAFEE